MNTSLYYDGSCPLCAKEISMLKGLVNSSSPIKFIDIHEVYDKSIPDKDTLLKRLHLRKANREWLLGLDATIYLWSQTPYAIFFKILKLWPIRSIANFFYTWWADRRFKKRYQCNC